MPNLNQIVNSTWEHLMINPPTAAKFPDKPLVCYKRNQNLRDLIGQTKISKGKVVRKRELNRGRCGPCNGRADAATTSLTQISLPAERADDSKSGTKLTVRPGMLYTSPFV